MYGVLILIFRGYFKNDIGFLMFNRGLSFIKVIKFVNLF